MHPLGEPWIQHKTDPDLNPTRLLQQRPTICQELWGAKSRVPALLSGLLGRFQSKTNRSRVAWCKAMWDGPWAGPDAHDPYKRMLEWLYKNPDKISMWYYMPKSIGHYWPLPEDSVPNPMQTHTLLLAALAAVAALSVLEHQFCQEEPSIAFAARSPPSPLSSFSQCATSGIEEGKTRVHSIAPIKYDYLTSHLHLRNRRSSPQ